MDQQTQPFQYAPLKEPRHIRILVLEPARRIDDPIHCSFNEVSLDNEVGVATIPYEALSYTWGAPQGTRPIFCHGSTILVTPNCEQALLHLRNRSKPRNMWIDAICINQQSIEEKNQQVPMMGDIYRAATRAILWLGPNTDPELSAVLRNAARYGSAVNGVSRLYRKVRKSDVDFDTGESYWRAPILSIAESEKIAQLCTNQWFSRVWTIQEFLLAKSATFLMGDVECPTLDLYTYYRLGKDLVKRADLEHYRTRNILAEASSGVTRIPAFKRLMILVLELTALSNASDPRDKVYGMNAYLKRVLPDIDLPPVDYANPLQEVYEQFTRFLIEITGSLWPLEFLGTHKPAESDMPSWVIDLRDPDGLASLWNSSWVRSSTSRSTLPEGDYQDIKIPYTAGELIVRAKSIAEVARTSSRMPFWDSSTMTTSTKIMDEARTACLSEWTAFVVDLDMCIDPADSPYVSTNGKYHDEPYSRTLQSFTTELDYLRLRHELKDDIGESSWMPDSSRAHKRKLKEREEKMKEALEDSQAYDDDVRAHDMSVLFLMSNGYLAESQGDVQEGDSVCLVEGSRYAMVLRSQENGYALIGKAGIFTDSKEESWSPVKLSEDPDSTHILLV